MSGKGGAVAMTVILGVVGAILAAIAVIYTGAYNVAADVPHTGLVLSILQQERANSIASRSKGIPVPADLTDDRRVRAGASEYAEMCSQCHLAPGMKETEIAQGLYPKAPKFARGDPLSPEQQYWVARHGIRFTSMPAWGPTHGDEELWNVVAFIRKLPSLSPKQYKAMTQNASEEHEHMMHGHEAHEHDEHGHDDMHGMTMPEGDHAH